MSAHAYPGTAVLADALRAASGLMLTTLPLCLADMPAWQTVVMALGAAIFVLYGLSATRRALSAVEVSDEAISLRGPWPIRLSWAEIDRLCLAYYSTRRDGSGGWMQLTLAGPHRRVVVDSRIDGFDLLVRRAAEAARAKALQLDAATAVNLRGLGIAPPAAARPQAGRR